MSATDQLLARTRTRARGLPPGDHASPPALRLAVVACMDARLDIYSILGLSEGDAHVIRNGGGAVTSDARRSLAISQRLLGTREIVLVHHTDCGMTGFTDDGFKKQIEDEVGIRPDWDAEAFTDLDSDVLQSIRRIEVDPFIPHTDQVRGFVYDVVTGELREVVRSA
ncbi:carbonic anhydrase [Nocardiopsis sp. CT-R113]|uniref:carbonic anhydrase n=1 Tax=Nocardiopsis codii TaxID=3065942 RepID=A0ABU7K1J4_9ACTN|nr:carbonic anhydrase [Nocardiopsis sp. CT-R113]MEE2035714.1 carbonic anhydrase [Nocardiopsis sp. CT-R113]